MMLLYFGPKAGVVGGGKFLDLTPYRARGGCNTPFTPPPSYAYGHIKDFAQVRNLPDKII